MARRKRQPVQDQLHQALTQLSNIQGLAQLGCWEWDILTDTVLWSDALYRLWGLDPDTFHPTYEAVMAKVHRDDRAQADQIIKQAALDGRPYVFEHRVVHPDGTVRLLQSRGTVVLDQRGRPIKMFGTGQDITERRFADDARARYTAVVESSSDAIYTKSSDGKILSWNAAAERLFGYRADEAIGRSVTMLAPPDRFDEIPAILERLRRGERIEALQTVRMRKDGTRVDVSVTISPMRDSAGTIVGSAAIARDFTAQKREEEALIRSEAQLREFAGRLRAAREAERTRIAREIHDELGQALTALKIDLFGLGQAVPDAHRDALQEKTRTMAAIVDAMVDKVRTLATELRPGVLDSLGLGAAIEWTVQQFARRTGLRCRVDLPPEPIRVDPDRSIDVFRIVQEALTNVARHATATQVEVVLRVLPDTLALTVHDNGRGITAREIADPRAFGLLGIRERALLWGGRLDIQATSEGGTTVTVAIPLAAPPPESVA